MGCQNVTAACPRPNMDLKGNDINLNTFPSGTTVSFACNVGYTSKGGSPSITCTNGNWSAVKLECERKNCGALTEVTNGQIDYPDGTQFGDKAVVTCNTGYIPVGGTNVICMDGGWSGRLPDCEVVTCAKPPAIENGDYSPKEDVYSYREVVMYSCQAGYTLGGSRSRTCSEDGSFKPEAPTCYEPRVANGRWMSGARPPYTEKSTVTLECNPGYIMRGTSTQTCENGSWASLPLPVLVLVYTIYSRKRSQNGKMFYSAVWTNPYGFITNSFYWCFCLHPRQKIAALGPCPGFANLLFMSQSIFIMSDLSVCVISCCMMQL
uniref:Sushi domain-containing protein n=1 Tax=Monopterus albus TaxID=43700 RepID=A0A3Q3JCU7_MONAL